MLDLPVCDLQIARILVRFARTAPRMTRSRSDVRTYAEYFDGTLLVEAQSVVVATARQYNERANMDYFNNIDRF